MRFTDAFIKEIGENIARMGLTGWHVCGGQSIAMSPHPTVMYSGGIPALPPKPPVDDGDLDISVFVKCECQACGNVQFYNAERHRSGDDPIFQRS